MKCIQENNPQDLSSTQNKPDYSTHLPRAKKPTRWSSGVCRLCGEHMDCVTHYHAGLHGYASAEDLIKSGAIIFD